MSVLSESVAAKPEIMTLYSSEYRTVDKVGVFGGGAQVMIQHFGQIMAVLLPYSEYERLCGLCPGIAAGITKTVSAGEIQQRPGNAMLGVKGGQQVVGIERYGQLRAALLPYPVWRAMKESAKESVPAPNEGR